MPNTNCTPGLNRYLRRENKKVVDTLQAAIKNRAVRDLALEYLIYPVTNGRLRRTDSSNQNFAVDGICIPEKTYFFGRGSYIHILPKNDLDRGVLERAKQQSRALHKTWSPLQVKRLEVESIISKVN